MNVENNKKNTILIVDDIPTNISLLLDYLGQQGFEVLVARDGESAIEQAQFAIPDLILLDVMMPGIDGFETCRRLKDIDETKSIPIIFMTALADSKDKVRGFNAGAVDYVTKPIQQEEVLARVKTHLSIRNLHKELLGKNLHLQQEITERKQSCTTTNGRVLETGCRHLQTFLDVTIAETSPIESEPTRPAKRPVRFNASQSACQPSRIVISSALRQ